MTKISECERCKTADELVKNLEKQVKNKNDTIEVLYEKIRLLEVLNSELLAQTHELIRKQH